MTLFAETVPSFTSFPLLQSLSLFFSTNLWWENENREEEVRNNSCLHLFYSSGDFLFEVLKLRDDREEGTPPLKNSALKLTQSDFFISFTFLLVTLFRRFLDS